MFFKAMRIFLIEPHDGRLYNNKLFDPALDPNFKTWANIRKLLKGKGIILDTIDKHPIEKAEAIYFLDHNFFSLKNNLSPYLAQALSKKINRKKLNLIITECPIIKPESWNKNNHKYYGRIFTWNSSVVDNKKYFHYFWIQNLENNQIIARDFKKKKDYVLVNAFKTNYLPNELYSSRLEAIRYLEKNKNTQFDLYGIGWGNKLSPKFIYSALKRNPLRIFNFIADYLKTMSGFPSYKGAIKDKIQVMAKYKYSICFENMTNIDGYVTEKIFDSFKAGCVPIYWGARDISRLVPKNTYIDFRKFKDFKEMDEYIAGITETGYNRFLSRIKEYLNGNDVKVWNYESFARSVFTR